MVEHTPWVGEEYNAGIEGQRLAIVGYSHWLGEGEKDSSDCTRTVISKVIGAEEEFDHIPFFVQIRNYFNFASHSDFWNRVLFFNYISECIGAREERYETATPDQIERAKVRFLRIIQERLPHKVLVFTTKGWPGLPATLEEQKPSGRAPRLAAEFGGFEWGTYKTNGHLVMAFGLRHPQGASGKLMRRVVQHILTMQFIKVP
jgi:hypothetical protein